MNLSKTTCLLALLLVTARCLAQDSLAPDMTHVTRITFLDPGVSYERGLSRQQSLYVHPYLSMSAGWSSTFGFNAAADPSLAAHYRYYYNRAKRVKKGKSTGRNSGNYLAAVYDVNYTTGKVSSDHITEDERRPVHMLAAAWGLQRNGSKRFCLDLNLGAGYLFAKGTAWNDVEQVWAPVNVATPSLYTKISLGFWLGKRN